MKKILFVVAAMMISATAFAADKAPATTAKPAEKTDKAPAAKTSKDDAVKAVFASIDAAFAKHDAKVFEPLFADDATFIAPMGDAKLIKGKAEIMKAHEAMFANGPMKDATAKHTVENIRWVGKDTAIVDSSVEFTGMHMDMPAGAPMPTFHALAVLTMKGGKWLLQDVRPYAIMPMPAPAPAKM